MDFIEASDVLVAKALALPQLVQIARAEVRARTELLNKWRTRAEQAASAAGTMVKGGKSIPSIRNEIDKVMRKWPNDVRSRYQKELTRSYNLARVAGWKKATGQTTGSLQYGTPNFTEQIKKAKPKPGVAINPTFDLLDEAAVADLHQDQMVWIGRHYDKNVRDTIRNTVRPEVIRGVSAAEGGKRMREAVLAQLGKISVPGGFNGTDAQYFEGLAANAITNARVRGQIRSFSEIQIEQYELVNPLDRRTTEICQHMNGKVFSVEVAVNHIEKLSGATDPDFVKANHPWLSFKQVQAISPQAGHVSKRDSDALARAGIPLPPFHFRCRTTVDAH